MYRTLWQAAAADARAEGAQDEAAEAGQAAEQQMADMCAVLEVLGGQLEDAAAEAAALAVASLDEIPLVQFWFPQRLPVRPLLHCREEWFRNVSALRIVIAAGHAA